MTRDGYNDGRQDPVRKHLEVIVRHVSFGLSVLLLSSPMTAAAQTAATTPPLASVEARWENVFCDLTEVSRPNPNELMVRYRYRNTSKNAVAFPLLTNIIPFTLVLDTDNRTVYGVLKDADNKALSSTTLRDIGSRPVPPGGTQAHWIKVQPPPDTVKSVTVIALGCMPMEAVPIGGAGSAALLTSPAKPIAAQDGDEEGLLVEVLDVRRAPGAVLNVLWRYRNSGGEKFVFPHLSDKMRQAYLTDPQNRKKYTVVTDKEKHPLASSSLQLAENGGAGIEPGGALSMWAKLAAPPEDVKTISLTVFGAPPFDNVAISGSGTGSMAGSAVSGSAVGLDAVLKDLGAKVTDAEIRIDLSADVLFDFDKADVKKAAEPQLQKVATVIKAHPDAAVSIEGHTDGKGTDAYNNALSEKRAASVKAWLAANADVNATKISTKGLGKTKPVAPNAKPDGSDDAEGRAKNRRVEVVVRTGA